MSTKLEFRMHHRISCRLLLVASSVLLVSMPPRPVRAEATCEASTPEEMASNLAMAEAAIRAKPSRSYQDIKKIEESLPCVTAVVDRAFLGELYRAKGMALLYLGNSKAAGKAFKQAGILDPNSDCGKTMSRFGTRGRVRQGIGLCEAAVGNAQGRMVVVKLEGLRGIAKLYVDGEGVEREEDYAPAEVSPGKHVLQYKQEDGGFSTKWLVVPAPEDPTTTTVWLNLKKLGLAPYVEEVVETGTLRIENLPPRAQVLLDGRMRRDLPVLRNVEVGERHLMIRTPDGTVMGAAVSVEANKETVYDVASIASARQRRGGGGGGSLDVRKIASYGALGVGALGVAGSGLLMVSASNTYADAQDAYEAYLDAQYGADFDTLYNDAESKRQDARKTQVTGVVLGSVAAVALGAGAYLMVTGDQGPLARVSPYLVPLFGRREKNTGLAMGLRIRF